MKKLFLLTSVLIFASSFLFAQNNPQTSETKPLNSNAPVASYNMTEFDYGEIEQGTPREATFELSNKGKEPLIITSARASCGCTNLKYSQEPILPGKTSNISVTYNAAAVGNFIKTITVSTNADATPVVLKIKGKVAPKKS